MCTAGTNTITHDRQSHLLIVKTTCFELFTKLQLCEGYVCD